MQITETSGGTITSTKQFVWCGDEMCEARNASSTVTAQYFPLGQTISGTSYYYTKDHLGSIRELTNSSAVIQSQYAYDPYGQVTKLAGSGLASDFQYAGYYYHAPSGLNLTLNRPYNSNLGRWINRDPIEEIGGVNLYCYVGNDPISWLDPWGLANCKKNPKVQIPQPAAPPNVPSMRSKTPPAPLVAVEPPPKKLNPEVPPPPPFGPFPTYTKLAGETGSPVFGPPSPATTPLPSPPPIDPSVPPQFPSFYEGVVGKTYMANY